MKKSVLFVSAMFLSLWVTNCAEMATGKLSYISGDNSEEVVNPNVVPQDFLNITEKMVGTMVNCDAIAKSSKPPLIVVHTINNTSKNEFNTKIYTESLRNLLINQWKEKACFIDKETSEKANYFLLGTISGVGSSQGNDSSEPYSPRRESWERTGNFDMFSQAAEEEMEEDVEEPNVILKTYKFSMRLTNADSGAIVWEDVREFKRKELQSSHTYPKKRPRGK